MRDGRTRIAGAVRHAGVLVAVLLVLGVAWMHTLAVAASQTAEITEMEGLLAKL